MDGISAYKEHAVVTQSPGQLVVMLYEGATRNLNQAITEMEAGRMEEKGKCINRAVEILYELLGALDPEAGGDIVKNLGALYTFMIQHVQAGHIKQDPQRLREVIKLLDDLNEGWKAITA